MDLMDLTDQLDQHHPQALADLMDLMDQLDQLDPYLQVVQILGCPCQLRQQDSYSCRHTLYQHMCHHLAQRLPSYQHYHQLAIVLNGKLRQKLAQHKHPFEFH
jgi:hypothetical protein